MPPKPWGTHTDTVSPHQGWTGSVIFTVRGCMRTREVVVCVAVLESLAVVLAGNDTGMEVEAACNKRLQMLLQHPIEHCGLGLARAVERTAGTRWWVHIARVRARSVQSVRLASESTEPHRANVALQNCLGSALSPTPGLAVRKSLHQPREQIAGRWPNRVGSISDRPDDPLTRRSKSSVEYERAKDVDESGGMEPEAGSICSTVPTWAESIWLARSSGSAPT